MESGGAAALSGERKGKAGGGEGGGEEEKRKREGKEEEEPTRSLWNFYDEHPDISSMTSVEVDEHRRRLGLVIDKRREVVHVPNPIRDWHHVQLMGDNLLPKILEMIREMGFSCPMPIQRQAIPVILSGWDCVVVSTTGSGKSLAYVFPMIVHVWNRVRVLESASASASASREVNAPIALVVVPTKELVNQVFFEIKKFADITGLKCVQLLGKTSWNSELDKGFNNIIVSTPHILAEIASDKNDAIIKLGTVSFLVLDEADYMMDARRVTDVIAVVKKIRTDCQTVMFSATHPAALMNTTAAFLANPIIISMWEDMPNRHITQSVEII